MKQKIFHFQLLKSEALDKQAHRKAKETLEFKLTQPREAFSSKPSISIQKSGMMGLTTLEVYKFISNITEEQKQFDLYTDTIEEFSIAELKDELKEILSISDITPKHLQQGKIGPRITKAFKKLRSEKSGSDVSFLVIMGYARSPVRDFEVFLRIVVGLDEDDLQLVLEHYISNFITYEISPGVYATEDISEVVDTKSDQLFSSQSRRNLAEKDIKVGRFF